jgi:hypothetical protein
MLPLLENETWLGDVRSSSPPVGMMVSMATKLGSRSEWESSCCCECRETRSRELVASSWTVIAGKLGVLRRLGEKERWSSSTMGSQAVEEADAKAESRRASSAASRAFLKAVEVLGPGDVLGRRTLLSQARAGVALEMGWERDWVWSCGDCEDEGDTETERDPPSPPGACAASSSLMAFRVFC